jgi:hypothetical protein
VDRDVLGEFTRRYGDLMMGHVDVVPFRVSEGRAICWVCVVPFSILSTDAAGIVGGGLH